jgi:hypothetical protein
MCQQVSSLTEGYKSISQQVSSLTEGFKTISQQLKKSFVDTHNFGRDRVIVGSQVSATLKIEGCFGHVTVHSFVYKGYVGSLITPHINCTMANSEQIKLRRNLFKLHKTKDLGIFSKCPGTEALLDISVSAIPKLGDRVVAFGYGNTASVWEGIVSLEVFENRNNITHWSGDTALSKGEYLIQSAQHQGMSGAPVSNGCGYLGIAHATVSTNFAAIIPAVDIFAFIDDIIRTDPTFLKRVDECPFDRSNTTRPYPVLSFPISPFIDCETPKLKQEVELEVSPN